MTTAQVAISHKSLALDVIAMQICSSPLVLDRIGTRIYDGQIKISRSALTIEM